MKYRTMSECWRAGRHTLGTWSGARASKAAMFLVAVALSASLVAEVPASPVKRVLILNFLNPLSSPGVAALDNAITTSLESSPYQIELYTEDMESTLFPDRSFQQQFRDWYIWKYRDRRPDVIITVGPEALKFMAEEHKRFAPGTPIVFCGLTKAMVGQLNLDAAFTGVWGVTQPEKTLQAALRIQPGTKHVAVVGGTGDFDRYLEGIVRDAFRKYESDLDFIYLTDLDMPALLDRLRQLPDHTIVYHTSIMQDAAGNHFIDATQSVPLVASAANAPVFVMDDVDTGRGAVGGDVLSWAAIGRTTAEMTVDILNGKKPQDIPIAEGGNVYLFDWQALKRWNLKEENLPPGSIVLNRQPGFWEAYKMYIILAVLLLFGQSAAIVALLRQRAQRRRVQTELRKSEEKFSKAFQRSPLAFTLASLVDFRLVEVNETFERYTGWKRDEVVNRTPLELNLWADVDQRSVFLAQIKEDGGLRDMEILFRRKDGEVRTGLVSSELIDLNGEPCALSLIADITEARSAEQVKRESEERFRLVANTAPVMIWMSGADKLCTYVNQPWLEFAGRTLEQELGDGWAEGLHREDADYSLRTYTESFDRPEAFEMQYRFRRHDGEYRWLLDRGVPRFNSDGSFAGYIGSCVDITERKLAEEALASIGRRLIEAQEEERTWIARELHDDINQRIALLTIELEQLRQHLPESLIAEHDHIRQRLSFIAKDIQALSHRLHSSKLEYLGIAVAANSFCKEFSEQHKVEINFSHIGIPRHLPNDISLCLFRVLQEALQNGVKHSGERSFKVELIGTSHEVHLLVADSGRGFDAFAAISNLGLGLISMQERMRRISGSLSIDTQPNRGTTIHARVPLPLESTRIAG